MQQSTAASATYGVAGESKWKILRIRVPIDSNLRSRIERLSKVSPAPCVQGIYAWVVASIAYSDRLTYNDIILGRKHTCRGERLPKELPSVRTVIANGESVGDREAYVWAIPALGERVNVDGGDFTLARGPSPRQ